MDGIDKHQRWDTEKKETKYIVDRDEIEINFRWDREKLEIGKFNVSDRVERMG